MKIVEAKPTIRYRVEYTDDELRELVATGVIHEAVLAPGSGRSRLWVSAEELKTLATSPVLSPAFKQRIADEALRFAAVVDPEEER